MWGVCSVEHGMSTIPEIRLTHCDFIILEFMNILCIQIDKPCMSGIEVSSLCWIYILWLWPMGYWQTILNDDLIQGLISIVILREPRCRSLFQASVIRTNANRTTPTPPQKKTVTAQRYHQNIGHRTIAAIKIPYSHSSCVGNLLTGQTPLS